MNRLSKIFFACAGLSIACFGVTRFLVDAWIPFLWIPIILSVGFFLAALFVERKALAEFMTMKTTKHGMNMGVLIALVVVVLAVVNFLGVRHYKVWDFSGNKQNTLSDQSMKLLNTLDSDLLVRFFYKKGVEGNEENRRAFRDLIKKYQDQSNKVKLEFVEVNERPDLAEQYGVTKGSGLAFLEYKGRRNRLDKVDEQELSSALVKVTREKEKTIYFTVGHGENDLEDSKEANGIAALKMILESNRYAVKTLPLNINAKIPDDADVIAIIGPKQVFLDYELLSLEEYLKKGGSIFVALKPKQSAGLEKLLDKIGFEPMNNYVLNVVDTMMGKGIQQGQTIATVFSTSNEITKVFEKNQGVLFRNPESFKRTKVPEGITLDDVVKTPETSMSFNSLDIKGEGPLGAYTLVMFAKGKFPGATDKEFNLVAFGDTDFLSNQLLGQGLNRDLVLNSMASLAKEQNLISIAPREAQVTKLTMTDTKFYIFLFGFIIPLPLLLLGTSITLWMRRRHA